MNLVCTTSVADILRILTILFVFFDYILSLETLFFLLSIYRHLSYAHLFFQWALELKHAKYRTLDKDVTLSKTDPTLQCVCWLHINYNSPYHQAYLLVLFQSSCLSLSSSFLPSLLPLPSCSSYTHLRPTVFQEHNVVSVVISVHVDYIPHARTCSCYWIWNFGCFAKYPHNALPTNPWQPLKSQCLQIWLFKVWYTNCIIFIFVCLKHCS